MWRDTWIAGYACESRSYECLILLFGMSVAPPTFTRCVKSALAPLESFGILPRWSGSSTFSNAGKDTHGIHAATHSSTGILWFLSLMVSVIARLPWSLLLMWTFHQWILSQSLVWSWASGQSWSWPVPHRIFPTSNNMSVGELAVLKFPKMWMCACASFHPSIIACYFCTTLTIAEACLAVLDLWKEPHLLCQDLFTGKPICGKWSLLQRKLHINYLKLLTVWLALSYFHLYKGAITFISYE